MPKAINVSLLVGLLALAGVANPALAAEPPEPEREIRAALYGWFAAAHGPLRVRGNEPDGHGTDFDFGDMNDDLDFTGWGRVDGQWEKWGFWLDGGYLKFRDGSSDRISYRMAVVDFGPTYTVFKSKLGDAGRKEPVDRFLRLNLLAGGRYWYTKASVRPSGVAKEGISKDWVDLIVGASLQWDISETMRFELRGDAGGFDFGSSNRMASNGVAELDIGLTDSFSVRAGFRFMNSYYNPGSPKFRQNISFFGPQVGLALKF